MAESKIYLRGVRAYGYVGLLPEENVLGQWFEVDAELGVDFLGAAQTDDIADTIDYRHCISTIENLIKTSKFALVERLAGAIVEELLKDKRIKNIRLKVIKHPPIPDFQGSIAVEIYQENTSPDDPPAAADDKYITAVYTDGSCLDNPGVGGWAAVINFQDGTSKELGGRVENTTNNQMELEAVIQALSFCQPYLKKQKIPLYTDSRYVKDGITSWIKNWQKNGWQTAAKQAVKNKEQWQRLYALNHPNVEWHWVQSHADNPDNNRCDRLARQFAAGQSPL